MNEVKLIKEPKLKESEKEDIYRIVSNSRWHSDELIYYTNWNIENKLDTEFETAGFFSLTQPYLKKVIKK